MDRIQSPFSESNLVSYLQQECPSFNLFWAEVSSIYSAKFPVDALPEDALVEFARHSLELYQDVQTEELKLIVSIVTNLRSDKRTRKLGTKLLRLIEVDWTENMSEGSDAFKQSFKGALYAA